MNNQLPFKSPEHNINLVDPYGIFRCQKCMILLLALPEPVRVTKKKKKISEAAYPGQSLSRSQIYLIIKQLKDSGDGEDKRGKE